MLRPVHVIINNCGQTEQAEPTSVRFTPAWHGGGLGLQRAGCHPLSSPLKRTSFWDFWFSSLKQTPLEGSQPEMCVLTSSNGLIWDFVLIIQQLQ